jgi:hypothetical protein
MEIVCHWTECSHAGEKKYYCYMDQIQPKKHFMGENNGTSVPLMKKVRILC